MEQINSATSGLPNVIRQQVANVVLNAVASAAGGAVGGISGAGGAAVADMFNRQLHPEEVDLAKKVAENARKSGIKNSDGSPISEEQVKNALRAANNRIYEQTILSGMVVSLDLNTQGRDIYDTKGMLLYADGKGGYYLVQDQNMLIPPSEDIRRLIRDQSGKENSPYSWFVPAPGTVAKNPIRRDEINPFSPGWNTGDYSAGLSKTDFRLNPYLIVQAGYHVPTSFGIAQGANASFVVNDRQYVVKPDVLVGGVADFGVNVGIFGDSKYANSGVVNIGLGKYLGVQITPANDVAWVEKPWYSISRYINGLSGGIGLGVTSPVNMTIDPTNSPPLKK